MIHSISEKRASSEKVMTWPRFCMVAHTERAVVASVSFLKWELDPSRGEAGPSRDAEYARCELRREQTWLALLLLRRSEVVTSERREKCSDAD